MNIGKFFKPLLKPAIVFVAKKLINKFGGDNKDNTDNKAVMMTGDQKVMCAIIEAGYKQLSADYELSKYNDTIAKIHSNPLCFKKGCRIIKIYCVEENDANVDQ